MQKIYKYPLEIVDYQTITMPSKAKILCVDLQHGKPMLWAHVDLECPDNSREIYIRGTGHEMHGSEGTFINSFQMFNGTLVYHVFDGGDKYGS